MLFIRLSGWKLRDLFNIIKHRHYKIQDSKNQDPITICQKSQEPNFCNVIVSFLSLAYANLGNSRTLSQISEAHLNIAFSMTAMAGAEDGEKHGLT